ncbi:hypothetical protein HPP92_018559 [Vanilla planifolia]|uniref:Uncharacterized protein n=1 Tax=Vanilla planifolia TaxID=51239 RepID=A0A835QC92_VANPL|nr:hypothetical protein HPP92_018559 [Vanilla planifolia]
MKHLLVLRMQKAQQDIPKEQIIDTQVLQSSGSQNTGLFESHQTLDEAQSSDQAKAGDLYNDFDEWETEFQAAKSATIGDMSKVIDPLQNPLEHLSDNSEAIPLQHRTIDLFQSHEAN